MLRYVARRLVLIVPQLLLVCLITFLLVDLAPGDPATILAGDQATPADVATVRQAYGLSDPIFTRFGRFLWQATRGDLGSSLYNSQSVSTIIANRLPVTVSLVLVAMVFAFILGVPAGVIAGVRRNRAPDRTVSLFAGLALAVPTFVSSVFLIKWFALDRSWLPSGAFVPFADDPVEWFKHLILPALALCLFPAAEIARQLRASVSNTLGRDYVDTARAKGLKSSKVLWKHTMKNAAIPAVTIMGVQVGRLLGGAVIVESIFNMPGLGNLIISSVLNHDIPTIQGIVLFTAVVVILINLLIDISYGYFNPRLRH